MLSISPLLKTAKILSAALVCIILSNANQSFATEAGAHQSLHVLVTPIPLPQRSWMDAGPIVPERYGPENNPVLNPYAILASTRLIPPYGPSETYRFYSLDPITNSPFILANTTGIQHIDW